MPGVGTPRPAGRPAATQPVPYVAYISVSLSTLFWGTSFVSVKALLREVSPLTVITMRFLMAASFLWLIDGLRRTAFRLRKVKGQEELARPPDPFFPPKQHLPTIALLGFIGVFVHHMLQANALRFTSSASAGWLIALNPLFIAAFASTVLKERFPARVKSGFALALLGVFLIVSKGDPRAALKSPSTVGDALMIASGVNWAAYTTILKRATLPYPPLLVTLWSESFGLLLLLPLWSLGGSLSEVACVSPAGWGHLASLGILSSGLAYLFWGRALSELSASRIAVFQYLQPTVTMTASALLLREGADWWLVAGGTIIITGIAAVNRPGDGPREVSGNVTQGRIALERRLAPRKDDPDGPPEAQVQDVSALGGGEPDDPGGSAKGRSRTRARTRTCRPAGKGW